MATTNISDLPSDTGANENSNTTPVQLHTREIEPTTTIHESQQKGSMILDQQTISQIVNDLQKASATGATQLTSRDIPASTDHVINDKEVQPNYVPQPTTKSFITDDETCPLDTLDAYISPDPSSSFYDEIQEPLLLGVLYFLFQLPIFKQMVSKYMRTLTNSDGNYNLYGMFFVSTMFGLVGS